MKRGLEHMSLALLDLDHFKNVNDTHGHDVGDKVIQEFARRLQENVRPMDIVCRQGGEEFLVIMPGTTGDLACSAAERMRRAIAGAPFTILQPELSLNITVSAGVATEEDNNEFPDALLKRADAALYHAKRSGRNRVESVAA
jgi:two-component system cell cycle response regulator